MFQKVVTIACALIAAAIFIAVALIADPKTRPHWGPYSPHPTSASTP